MWLRTSGAVFGLGSLPSRIDGIALKVESYTVWPFGNQVDIDASSAKFGNRSASICPSGPSRSSVGNSSKTKTTTGGRRSACWAELSPPMPAQPASTTAAASSAASQENHRALIGYLEHLHPVAAFAQRILRNHD